MLEEIYFKEFADYFKKWFEKNYENLAVSLRSNDVNAWLSSGSTDHWLDSIQFALNTKGYMIWGKRVDDLSSLTMIKSDSRAPKWHKFISSISIGPLIENYIDMIIDSNARPVINVFYVSGVGIVGAGIFITVILDANTLFWKKEMNEKRVVYPIRWLTKVFWLHETLRKDPLDPSKWEGVKPPNGIPLQSGLQPIRNPEYVKIICELLLEHEKEYSLTQQFFEEYYKKRYSKDISLAGESVSVVLPTTCIIDTSINVEDIKSKIMNEFVIDEDVVDWILSLLLYSCKNILLVGKPGTGKTSLARRIAEILGFRPVISTAHAHWSRHDVIGGPMLSRNGEVIWRSGILIKALAEHFRAKRNGGRGAWLIIDEINRTDVDKAFGEFFTIFSGADASEWIIPLNFISEVKEYYDSGRADEDAKEFLNNICRDGIQPSGCRVPQDFRVIATLNYIDVANLFTLGEAFVRRFARIIIGYNTSEEFIIKEIDWLIDKKISLIYSSNVVEELKKITRETDLVKMVQKLRGIQGIAFGPAHLFTVLQNIAGYICLKKDRKEDPKTIIRRSIEAVLTLSPLWDERLRSDIENALGTS